MLAAATAKSSLIWLLHAEHIILFLTNLFLLTTIWTFIISSLQKKILHHSQYNLGCFYNRPWHKFYEWLASEASRVNHAWKIIVDLTLGQDHISHKNNNNNNIDILCHLCKIFFGIQMHQEMKQRKNVPYLSSTIKSY